MFSSPIQQLISFFFKKKIFRILSSLYCKYYIIPEFIKTFSRKMTISPSLIHSIQLIDINSTNLQIQGTVIVVIMNSMQIMITDTWCNFIIIIIELSPSDKFRRAEPLLTVLHHTYFPVLPN